MLKSELKLCSKCLEEKELNLFRNNSKNKDGKHRWCKNCHDKVNSNNYKKVSDARISQVMKWQKENPKKVEKYTEKFYSKRRENNKKPTENRINPPENTENPAEISENTQ